MTREEATKMAKADLECMERDISGQDEMCNSHKCDECSLNYEKGNMGEQKEWLRMAIQALEQSMLSVSEKPNNCDLISRKALLSHIENQSREWGEDYDAQQILGDIEDMQPQEPKWIPVSERLPKTDNENTINSFNVLLWVKNKTHPEREAQIYLGKLRYVDGDDGSGNFWGIETKPCEWTIWGWSYFNEPEVIAWMPLPKPYVPDINIGNMSEIPTSSEPQDKQPEISSYYGLKSYVGKGERMNERGKKR